ncbi:MAG TPA: NAD(P)-dependent oxidoreductase [Caulobacteraceae bacterium]|nr:NAD(P)-dependent oxidoreductase [Caulobacteraceae bacterium]
MVDRVLVTGASGFVGRQAVKALLAAGADVHAVSRTPLAIDCNWHGTDLLDPAGARALLDSVRPDAVLHLAWCVDHGRFWTDPANADWVAATLSLGRAAAEAGARHFTGVGTCYEYDWPSNADCREYDTRLKGHTLYDVAKSSCRSVLDALFRELDLGFAWTRLFFLYGPDEDPRRLVASIARALARNEPAACSRGLAIRDLLDVRDAGAALAAVTLAQIGGAVNIGSGIGHRTGDVATTLGRLAGRPDLIRLGSLPDVRTSPRGSSPTSAGSEMRSASALASISKAAFGTRWTSGRRETGLLATDETREDHGRAEPPPRRTADGDGRYLPRLRIAEVARNLPKPPRAGAVEPSLSDRGIRARRGVGDLGHAWLRGLRLRLERRLRPPDHRLRWRLRE